MNDLTQEILDQDTIQTTQTRRGLLPLWIKVFIWLFFFFGGILPIGLVFGLLGWQFDMALYGLETTFPLSLSGLTLFGLFAVKGMVSFSLWTEKDWGVRLAIADAMVGIVICLFDMFVMPFLQETPAIGIRLELIPLIPYFIKMRKIRTEWATTAQKQR